jgi:6-phosphogluconolactonase
MMVRVFPDLSSLSQAAAELFVTQSQQALAKGRFSVALSGGNTPRQTYELLASSPLMDQVPWHIVHFFWSDERWVPPYDPQSNQYMARQTLLNRIPVPEDQIHPMVRFKEDIGAAVQEYENDLRDFFAGERQLFDFVFLGLGEDGHTASLFPHDLGLQEHKKWVGQTSNQEQGLVRVTLTQEAINQSGQIVFLVSGAEKAEILHHVLEDTPQPEVWPAQLIKPKVGELTWLVDEAAAQCLSPATRKHTSTVWR